MVTSEIHLKSLEQLNWRMPVHVRFGWGILDEFVPNQHSVVLADANAICPKLTKHIQSKWHDRVLAWIDCDRASCDLEQLNLVSHQIWPHLDSINTAQLVAIGGGSILDMAKILRWAPKQKLSKDNLDAHWRSQGDVIHASCQRHHLICWPTTSGTGSEVSASATLWDRAAQIKLSWQPQHGHADEAWVDPQLSVSCPTLVSRDAGLDALSHALESLWNSRSSIVSRPLALEAIRLVFEHLPNVMANPQDRRARTSMSKAALLAGLAMSETQTALAHALSYEVTLTEKLSHGESVAIWLPFVAQRAFKSNPWLESDLLDAVDWQGSFSEFLSSWLKKLSIKPRDESEMRCGMSSLMQALKSTRGQNQI